MLKPGTYKLGFDLGNPEPDRRHARDWRKFAVWKAGMEFVVIEKNRYEMMDENYLAGLPEETRSMLKLRSSYTVIQFVGDRWPSLHEIGPGNEAQYNALSENLVSVEESLDAMLTRIGAHNEGFSAWLVETAKVSRELFESWWNEYQTAPEKT